MKEGDIIIIEHGSLVRGLVGRRGVDTDLKTDTERDNDREKEKER